MSYTIAARGNARYAIFAAAVISATSLGAQSSQAADEPTENPIVVFTRDAATTARGGAADLLIGRAQQQGQVRVIVGLRTTMRMEHALAGAQAARQRAQLISLQDGVATRVLGSPGAQGIVRFSVIPYMSMWVDAEQTRRLITDPQVASIQEDIPKLPTLSQSTKVINADNVWARGFAGANQTIAVLDTGVAKTHPMFAGGKIVSEACYSTTSGDFRSVCPGGVAETTAAGSGVNCNVAWKGCDHGTHVAGIAAGNSNTLNGVARDSRIIAIQVFSRKTTTTPDSVVSFDTDQVKALERVYALRDTYKIASVNMSLGGGKFAATCDADSPAVAAIITTLRSAGIATIIASGNNGFTGFIGSPACISTAIAVGNTMKDDVVAKSSNHSSLVKLMAPGSNIKSALPDGTTGPKSGTSMAAPHVAGAFAMLRNAKKTATVDQLLEALTCSGKIVDQRFVEGGDPIELPPQKPRIDMLGAYNHLKKPKDVLRAWQFQSEADLNDWSPLRGTWKVAGGNYTATPAAGGLGSHVANCNTRLTITARMKRVDPQSDFAWNSGLMFKSSANFMYNTVSGYWAAYNKCRLDTVANECSTNTAIQEGMAVLWRIFDFDHNTSGVYSAALLCMKSTPVNVDRYNTIRVVSDGASHSYYLNDKLVCTVNEATFAAGGVTLNGFFPGPAAGHHLQFDAVSIQSIGANDVADTSGAEVLDPAAVAPVTTPASHTIMGIRQR